MRKLLLVVVVGASVLAPGSSARALPVPGMPARFDVTGTVACPGPSAGADPVFRLTDLTFVSSTARPFLTDGALDVHAAAARYYTEGEWNFWYPSHILGACGEVLRLTGDVDNGAQTLAARWVYRVPDPTVLPTVYDGTASGAFFYVDYTDRVGGEREGNDVVVVTANNPDRQIVAELQYAEDFFYGGAFALSLPIGQVYGWSEPWDGVYPNTVSPRWARLHVNAGFGQYVGAHGRGVFVRTYEPKSDAGPESGEFHLACYLS